MRIFVDFLISFDAQMFFSMTKAIQAFPILAITSLSVPPCLSTTLPRHTNDSTSLILWLSTLIGALEVVLIFMSSVFLAFTLSPTQADVVAKRVVISCITP